MKDDIDYYEVIKCVFEVIGKENLISEPKCIGRNVLIKVKNFSKSDILKYEKEIANKITNFTSTPYGIVITSTERSRK